MLIVAGGNPQLQTLSDSPVVSEMIDLSKTSAVKYSANAQRQTRIGLLMETTGQHCPVFNLAEIKFSHITSSIKGFHYEFY